MSNINVDSCIVFSPTIIPNLCLGVFFASSEEGYDNAIASLSHSPTAYMQVCRAHAALNSVQLAAAAAASSSARSAIALAHEFMKLQWDNWLDACTPSLSQVRMAGCMDG